MAEAGSVWGQHCESHNVSYIVVSYTLYDAPTNL